MMRTTVHFATNRVVDNPADAIGGYRAAIVPSPAAMTYGTALVEGIDLDTNAQGVVSQIAATSVGRFPEQAIGDLADAGRDLLVFVHGFDNTFSDAITRAAFNREWLAASGAAAADTTVVAFSWPSKGQIAEVPDLEGDYRFDQSMARNSALHLMTFLANLEPILSAARKHRQRSILLAHSMGNLALQGAVESWFQHGNGDAVMFDHAILAAADCDYDTFAQPGTALSGLVRLAARVAIYYSRADRVLDLSEVLNLTRRLGQNGPRDRADAAAFPPAQYLMEDCSAYRDYDVGFLNSHQYYRQSKQVRALIAANIV